MVPNICVVGLGYVGLPLALKLSQHFNVMGFDLNSSKIKRNMLLMGCKNLKELNQSKIIYRK